MFTMNPRVPATCWGAILLITFLLGALCSPLLGAAFGIIVLIKIGAASR